MSKEDLKLAYARSDSIAASIIIEQPDFDDFEELMKRVEMKVIEFINDMQSLMRGGVLWIKIKFKLVWEYILLLK